MKLAYSTNGFARVSCPQAITAIAKRGFAGVEILADRPHWRPGDDPQPIAEALRRAGVFVSNVNANTAMGLWPEWMPETIFEPALSSPDPEIRARRMRYTEAAMDLAVAVGAGVVSVTSGRIGGHGPEREVGYFIEALAALAARAAARGLRLSVEYEPGLLIERSAELAEVIAAVDHPALGANLDLGHAQCIEDPYEAIARLKGRIWNVHIEDIKGRKHHHLIPGQGDMDFRGLLGALKASGYQGPITVELYTCSDIADEAAARAYAHLAPILNEVMREGAP
ncbi:sugar phosphate isomerase/epimerase [Myxococcota bacterium]|nr:sugar phosphate isomerase/epimerase [Myxococcota bacterium]MBU1431578.1 sugar phosphate isomerase/epimerase [Myxococcota bacterium]MBU1897379.1 sugar phosphate isomerase/epimerase [Myxococcota bacterium]